MQFVDDYMGWLAIVHRQPPRLVKPVTAGFKAKVT